MSTASPHRHGGQSALLLLPDHLTPYLAGDAGRASRRDHPYHLADVLAVGQLVKQAHRQVRPRGEHPVDAALDDLVVRHGGRVEQPARAAIVQSRLLARTSASIRRLSAYTVLPGSLMNSGSITRVKITESLAR